MDADSPNQGVKIARRNTGYGKPPTKTRFKPGQSGNPEGRPKGARNKKPMEGTLAAIVQKEANRPLKPSDGGKPLTMAEAVVRKTAVSAVQGNGRAQRQFADLVQHSELQIAASVERLLEAVMEYKTAWAAELATRAAKGLTGPAPIPPPDHLVVDFKSGTVTAIGPLTPDQNALAITGGPGHEAVPSPSRPFVLSGSRAQMLLLKSLPQDQWRLPAPANPGQKVDGFKTLCEALDEAARIKAALARRSSQDGEEE